MLEEYPRESLLFIYHNCKHQLVPTLQVLVSRDIQLLLHSSKCTIRRIIVACTRIINFFAPKKETVQTQRIARAAQKQGTSQNANKMRISIAAVRYMIVIPLLIASSHIVPYCILASHRATTTITTMSIPSRLNLCHQSSFSAENTMITIVPSFHYSSRLPFLSSPFQQDAGPFVAGMPADVPLWMAKALYQRQLAQIRLPEWLSTAKLTEILKEEKQETTLTTQLPFFYFEIARALAMVVEKSAQVVLQDLVNVRVDKIRQNFHDLSRGELQRNEGELPMISVTGIARVELNMVGPFLQRAFSDHGFLTQRPQEEKGVSVGGEKAGEEVKKVSAVARSRLRRFRQ